MIFVQCTLRRNNVEQVSWIPMKFALHGNVLRLKNHKGIWENGWEVIHLGNSQEEHLIHDPHIAVKQHRKRTGDSLPKYV
jgi:hypothetical protein